MPIATRSQIPYFLERDWTESPATERAPPSESLFLLLPPVERCELLRVILGVAELRALRKKPLSSFSDLTEAGRFFVAGSGVEGAEAPNAFWTAAGILCGRAAL